MTMPIKFDTLQYTNSLIEAGIPADQAEAQAQALTQAMDEATVAPSELVLLRTDILARIEMLRIEMDGKFSELRAEMNGKFNELRAEMNGKFNELRAEMNGKFDAMRAYIDRKLTTVYWMVGISLALQAVQITGLIYIISRLP
jgi:DNA anti-recombination protein RmuC